MPTFAYPIFKPAVLSDVHAAARTAHVIEQMASGRLILAPAGEAIVESRDFYAAFVASIEYRVDYSGQSIGSLTESCIPEPGEFLLLAGRRWQAVDVDPHSKVIHVQPAKKWQKPRFEGGGGEMHSVIATRMKQIIKEDGGFPFLASGATKMLHQARTAFRAAGLASSDIITQHHSVVWFPWSGSRVLRTLELMARAAALKVASDGLSLRYVGVSVDDFRSHLKDILADQYPPERLVPFVASPQRDRFDEYVDQGLLLEAYIAEMLDFDGVRAASDRVFLQ